MGEIEAILQNQVAENKASFDLVAGESGKWLPRIQLASAKSGLFTDGKVPLNHFAIIAGNNVTVLAPEVDVLVANWRPKALNTNDPTHVFFDPQSKEFKDLIELAGVKDSGVVYGPEYLVYVPLVKKFALLHMNSKSSRREAPNIHNLLGKVGTLYNEKIETEKYKWQGIKMRPCNAIIENPTPEALNEALKIFKDEQNKAAPEAAAKVSERGE